MDKNIKTLANSVMAFTIFFTVSIYLLMIGFLFRVYRNSVSREE